MIPHFLKGVFFPLTNKKKLKASVKSQKKSRGIRDEVLEKKARELLMPHATDLAEQIIVGWKSRLRTTAGIAIYQHKEVWLNPALKKISEEEVEKTLRHELAHLLAHARYPRKRIAPHGIEWQVACTDLGIPNESRTHQLPFVRRTQKPRFLYRCPACHETLPRVRKPRRKIACLACCRLHAGGRYDERFQYIEVEPKNGNGSS